MSKLCFEPSPRRRVAVIGVGKIGQHVAKTALKKGLDVVLYSPSLSNGSQGVERLKEIGLEDCSIGRTIQDTLRGANYVSIAIPLIHSGEKRTLGIFEAVFFEALADGTNVVSVSEPGVFSEEAIETFVTKTMASEMMLTLDNAPRFVDVIRNKYPNRPDRFCLQSMAMKAPECQKAMDQAALKVAESWNLACLVGEVRKKIEGRSSKDDVFHKNDVDCYKKEITIVGAGISGLITAYHFVKAGYFIQMIDGGPDPRQNKNWKNYLGSSHVANIRHASATETLPYSIEQRKRLIHLDAPQGGWKTRDFNDLDSDEQEWIKQFEAQAGTQWLNDIYVEDIVTINSESIAMWKSLFQENPELFSDAAIRDNVVRLFLNEKSYALGKEQQYKANTVKKVLSNEELIQQIPGLKNSCDDGVIVGGIAVEGFSLYIKNLSAKLLQYLEENGVKFSWNKAIQEIKFDDNGKVEEIKVNDSMLCSKNTLVTLGSRAHGEVFQNTKFGNQVMGVAGLFLELPNVGISGPIKIHAPDPIGVINVNLNEENLMVSGGFGLVGKKTPKIDDPSIQELFRLFESVVKQVLPEPYHKSVVKGSLENGKKLCVRPMTPHGLSVMETIDAVDGGKLVLMGGSNAGGFTQAPITAKAALDYFEERNNKLHKLFHPLRSPFAQEVYEKKMADKDKGPKLEARLRQCPVMSEDRSNLSNICQARSEVDQMSNEGEARMPKNKYSD